MTLRSLYIPMALLLFALTSTLVRAQEDSLDQAQMAEMMKMTQPGPIHEKLANLVGEWKVESTLELPGMEPQTTEGDARFELILGGRFLCETGSGSINGFDVEHHRIWGYNNGSKKFEAIWLYTMSTAFLKFSGTTDDDCKTIDWVANVDNEMGIKQEFKIHTVFVDDNNFTVSLEHAGDEPGPTLKNTYRRVE